MKIIFDSEEQKNAFLKVLGNAMDRCPSNCDFIDLPLDDLNPTNNVPYSLNVSSLGLDRPITTEYEFNKYKGKDVELKFYEPLKPYNKKVLEGELNGWNEDSVTVIIGPEKTMVQIPKKSIAQIVPVIKF